MIILFPSHDLAGFATGIVEQSDIVDGGDIHAGDLIIGIESSGIHSNGYSMINHLAREGRLKITDEFLKPTHIYTSLVNELLNEVPVLGMANITGGGIPENLPRCFPSNVNRSLKPMIDWNSWEIPDIFNKIMKSGDVNKEEMWKTFNMGIGYCIVIPEYAEKDAHDTINALGYESWTIGKVIT